MKASVADRVETLVNLTSDFSDRIVPAGTQGGVVEVYEEPEGYAVDLAIAAPELAGGNDYENIILKPDQFVVISKANMDEGPS